MTRYARRLTVLGIGSAVALVALAALVALVALVAFVVRDAAHVAARSSASATTASVTVEVHAATRFDISGPLSARPGASDAGTRATCGQVKQGCGVSPLGADPDAGENDARETGALPDSAAAATVDAAGAAVEQRTPGTRPPAALVASFDGLGAGFVGPQGEARVRNPSDNSLAVGPNHIVQIVNSRMAVFTKKGAMFDTTGKVLYGPVVTNTIFAGFGGQCEHRTSGDAVVRYDQLAGRWLYVLPIFRRPPDDSTAPYSMCYAVSTGPDPLGPYARYEFKRPLFPDYPRPAIWTDGYYLPTSTGDHVIQKHACVADRSKMLQGLPATEQCLIINGVNFLNMADIDGVALPPAGAPDVILAGGGTQLHKIFDDSAVYVYRFHVDWQTPANTRVTGPDTIRVAPYHYLCDGQLTSCVPQPNTDRRLDAQGDKIMQRVVYRRIGNQESILAEHSVNTTAGGGGIRWYELRFDSARALHLYQQGTYAPDSAYRWMASMAMDREGGIGIGYSFGGTPNFPGQRFAGRLAGDPKGVLTLRETVLAEGQASQTNTLRWEDYTTTAMDPSDDCTFWYVGDYFKTGESNYTSRIGAFRLPGCLRTTVRGTAYFDINHNGHLDSGEPSLHAWPIAFTGGASGLVDADTAGQFSSSLAADPMYFDPTYTFSMVPSTVAGWAVTGRPATVTLHDRDENTGVALGSVCTIRNRDGAGAAFWTDGRGWRFWSGDNGHGILDAHDAAWRAMIDSTLYLVDAGGSRFSVRDSGRTGRAQLDAWLRNGGRANTSYRESVQLALLAFNTAYRKQDARATVHDPVVGDWPTIAALIARVNDALASPSATGNVASSYAALLQSLNDDRSRITPANPSRCPRPF